jgi:hypothetical protein
LREYNEGRLGWKGVVMVLKFVLNHRWHFPDFRLADRAVVDRRV